MFELSGLFFASRMPLRLSVGALWVHQHFSAHFSTLAGAYVDHMLFPFCGSLCGTIVHAHRGVDASGGGVADDSKGFVIDATWD